MLLEALIVIGLLIVAFVTGNPLWAIAAAIFNCGGQNVIIRK